MDRAVTRPSLSRTQTALIALCLLVALAPNSWLEVFSPDHWQHEMIHLTGLVGAGLAGIWPWAVRQDGATAGRFFVWLLLGVTAMSVYVVSASPLFLLTGFTILFAGMVNTWMARAHMASREYRERLERRTNP